MTRRQESILRRAIRTRSTVRVALDVKDEYVHGFPLALSDEFLLMREERDLWLDGYYVIPLWNFKEVRAGRFERSLDRIAKREGWLRKLGKPPRGVSIDSPALLLRGLQRRGRPIIIETTGLIPKSRPGESVLLIGPVVKVGDDAVWIHNFSATGKWDRRPEKVRFDDIATVQFASNYINVWRRNLDPPTPQSSPATARRSTTSRPRAIPARRRRTRK
jgi:hypothetical protein